METSMRVTPNVSLAMKAATILRTRIKEEYPNGGRIPGEHELAKQLGVNRGTVRQALQILEREGVVIRRQGAGTFANEHVLGIKIRLENVKPFTTLIQEAGYEPTVVLLSVEKEIAPDDIIQQLGFEPQSTLLISQLLVLADGNPAIYVKNMIPVKRIKESYDESDLRGFIFDFVERRCHARVEYGMSEIIPRICGKEIADILDLEPTAAVLQFNNTYYDEDNNPILFGEVFPKDPIIRFHVMMRII